MRNPSAASTEGDRHYRQIVQSAVDYAVFSCDTQGRLTTWNAGAARMLGWSEAEILGQGIEVLYAAQDVALRTPEREMAAAGQPGPALRWHVRKNGERVRTWGKLMPLRDAEGTLIGYAKVMRDELAGTPLPGMPPADGPGDAVLELALGLSGIGVWEADLRTGAAVRWVGMHETHGLPADTPAPTLRRYLRLVHPLDRRGLAKEMLRTIAARQGQHGEYRVVWPDGSVHWLENRSRLLLDEQGHPRGMTGFCLDITGRKHEEKALSFLAQASSELAALSDYQTTLDKIARLAVPEFADWCAVDLLEANGVIRRVAVAHVDPALTDVAREVGNRYPPDPLAPKGPWAVLRSGRSDLEEEVTEQALEMGIRDPGERALVRMLGVRSYLGVPLVVRGKSLGVISFFIGRPGRHFGSDDRVLAEDLAGRAAVAIDNARLLAALRDSDRAKDVFLATLAHELRNPLAPVWNGLTIIKRLPGDAARVQQLTELIERQVRQLARLVDDLLDVSRISTGKIELHMEPTELAAVLRSAMETSRPHIEAGRHKLSVTLPDEPLELEADPVRLAQVFSNLLNNAAKYTRPGGRIALVVEAEPDHLVVRVRDNGFGIAPEMLTRVFELFTQVTHPIERSQGGLGIGLSLVQGLVRLHGGRVEAHSGGVGQGSEFRVTLPRAMRAAAPVATPDPAAASMPPATAPHAARRILVVDDNHDAAGTLAELLRILGMDVRVVNDGLSAVAEAQRFEPQIVLLDIGLPDINGYEVARRIRQLPGLRQPRLIALTGWGQNEDKRMAAQAGFDEHWTKPVDPARIQQVALRDETV